MFRGTIVPAALAAVLSLFAPAASADGEKGALKTLKDTGRRIEDLDLRARLSSRGSARMHRHHYRTAAFHHGHYYRRAPYRQRTAYGAWDGRYGLYPRQHLFITGVSGYGLPGPVNVATVTYRSYIYYTPTYPSMSYGYPPYAHLYDLTPGPVYNKPCFC